MKMSNLTAVGLAAIFALSASPAVAGDRNPDQSINYGVSTRQIENDHLIWLEGKLVKGLIDDEPVTNIDTYNSFNAPGSGNAVAVGTITDFSGCNGDANCQAINEFNNSSVGAEINNIEENSDSEGNSIPSSDPGNVNNAGKSRMRDFSPVK